MKNLTIDPERLWDDLMSDRQDRRHRQGRHLPADADRSRPASARLVQGALREPRLHRHHRRHGHDVRATRRPARRYSAHRHGQPSRHPADRRQVRRCAWRAGGARSADRAHPRRLRDLRAHRSDQLDQRGRLAVYAGDDRVRRLCRRVHARRCGGARRPRPAKPSAPRSTKSAIAGRNAAATTNSRRSSRCTSNRARSSRPRARTSASSPACRRCAGTRSR